MDPTLDYISRYLLEEEIDELNISAHKDEVALQEIEKPFYEILGQKYPPSPNKQLVASCQSEADISSTFCLSKAQVHSNSTSKRSMHDTLVEGLPDMPEFHRGLEEGLKFLPSINMVSVDTAGLKEENPVAFKLVDQKENVSAISSSRIKKKSNWRDLDNLEGRNGKMSMVYYEEPITNDVYDKVLLDHGHEHIKEETSSLQEILQHEAISGSKEEIQGVHTELCTLLIRCSEAVARYDQHRAQMLLKRVRMHSSPNGIGIQRLGSVLADALEARLAGAGSEYYKGLVAKRVSTPNICFLKAYHLYLKAAPFARVYYCFSNHNILNAAKNCRKLHVIDLGIRFGFQWPSLIQALAKREGGPPQLRITGVEFPEPGFRPAKRVENMGQKIEEYARNFNVPFEYKGIALQWELIRIEDLNINDDEVLVVNSMIRFKKVKDEIFEIDSPRDRVLKLIRDIKPQIFIQGESCRSYSPYFLVRFKQVLSTYSVFFDLLDTTIPRGNTQRQLLENIFFVPDIINIVACEGSDWIERPETLKQWQRRNQRAGFEQLPVDPDIMKECNNLVRNDVYDKRYFIDEDDNWLLQGWKGRVLTGVTAWKPKPD